MFPSYTRTAEEVVSWLSYFKDQLCKVNEAEHLLDEGNLKIYEVAERLGFESSFYFSKVFKKIEGVSPTDYVSNRKI